MRHITVLLLMTFAVGYFATESIAVPLSPELSIEKTGTTIEISWTSVEGADGYRIHYAPHPYTGPDSIGTLDAGVETETSYTLWDGASYYVAVTAYDETGNSRYSNTELFLLGPYTSDHTEGTPELTVETDALEVFISWTSIPGATGYRLYYAPYPLTSLNTIGSADMASVTAYDVTLWDGAAFYVAVTSEENGVESGYSNIELLLTGDPFPVWQNLGYADGDEDGYSADEGDCNDGDATVSPLGVEVCGDGIDQDCDGVDPACSKECDADNLEFCSSSRDCSDADGYWNADLSSCAASIDYNVSPISIGTWYQPSVSVTWQWQLEGAIDTTYEVDLYDIDLFDTSEDLIQQLQASGKKVICYFSAGSYENWRSDANLFADSDLGNTLDGWDDERWLDIRSTDVHALMKSRLDLAVQKNCDGVEPDNMDGYNNNSGFNLTATDQLAFNRFIANEAHIRGLSVGLKNDLDQIEDLVDYYDFAVNEQCFEYEECDTLAPFINNGKAVLNAEYKQEYVNDQTIRDTMCGESLGMQLSTLILPLLLDNEFRLSCQPQLSFQRNDTASILSIRKQGSLQNPAWAPDSETILFTRFERGYNKEPADLLIIDLESGSVKQIVSDGNGNINLPGSVWNEETGTIVFSSSRGVHDEIFIIGENAEPGNETQITDRVEKVAYEPSLSPDGEWVVFESHPLDVEGNGIITIYKLDGSEPYLALSGENDDCRQPNWSPAGDRILYQKFTDNQWDIWTVNIDGNNHTKVTSGSGDKTDASFSPDGQWIVYSSDEGDLSFANLFVIPVSGGTSLRITNHEGYDGAPSWSPDGQKIAFESYPGEPDDSDGTFLWLIDVAEH